MAESEDVPSGDIIRIMVATDNHLGYAEKDAIRGQDSFTAFEEILQMAVEEGVDFILLGGDLFHDAVPSQNALMKCMTMLRRYSFGDNPISIEILSDQAVNFHNSANETVNFEDPNLNISIPVFSIHGNHDDPSGFGRLSSLDLLSTTGLVNYFGRWTDLTQVNIKPILIRKGETQMALYGLSHIHDARLTRLFESSKVNIERPGLQAAASNEDATEDEEWFHLMVLHQNRADRGIKNYLPEESLPDFLNLIIWGHEHDCRIVPEFNTIRNFYVSQPGSSVPTSLAAGEAIPKQVGLLEIYKTKFQMKPLPLQTIRPFIFDSINIDEMVDELGLDEGDAENKVRAFAEKRINELIEKSKEQLTGHPQQPTLPLIRLRLVFTNESHMFNAIRFGQMYNEKVANPADIINFKKQIKRVKHEGTSFDKKAMNDAFEKMDVSTSTRVEDLVDRYFEEVDDKRRLQIFPSKALSEMCYRLVERRDNNAVDNIVQLYKEKALAYLMEKLPRDDEIDECLLSLKETITQEDILKMLDEPVIAAAAATAKAPVKTTTARSRKTPATKTEDTTNADGDITTSTPSRGGSRGGRAARGGRRGATNRSAMPKLDVSINASRSSSRQSSILDAIETNRNTTRRAKKIPTYQISDDSD